MFVRSPGSYRKIVFDDCEPFVNARNPYYNQIYWSLIVRVLILPIDKAVLKNRFLLDLRKFHGKYKDFSKGTPRDLFILAISSTHCDLRVMLIDNNNI